MTTGCAPFRAELERAAAGPPAGLALLASHAHVQACAGCRRELGRERGLERLLERLPAPESPPSLARRVLAGLHGERLGRPAVLGDPELDELLEHLPEPRIPAGLATRVLREVEPARSRPARSRRPRLGARRMLLLGAAALLAVVSLWAWAVRPVTEIELARGADEEREVELEVDEELIAYAVERWELLHDEDLDVWLACLDPLDELLMEYAGGEAWLEGVALEDGGASAVESAPSAHEGD